MNLVWTRNWEIPRQMSRRTCRLLPRHPHPSRRQHKPIRGERKSLGSKGTSTRGGGSTGGAIIEGGDRANALVIQK